MSTPTIDDTDLQATRERYRLERERRLRRDGVEQYREAEGDFARFAADPLADPDFTREAQRRTVDAVVIGGGLTGIVMGANLRQAGLEDICIVEKGTEFGGTWYWNRYPGAQCDVESYIYIPMLEELGYVPSERYAHQPEIQEHLLRVVDRYDLRPGALLQTEATSMVWDENAQVWHIATNRGDDLTAKYMVIAAGDQHAPRLPGVEGIETFAGHTWHTARWDSDYTGPNLENLADKRVGVVGTGATGLQVVPHVGAAARELFVFQRTPSTVGVRDNRPTPPDFAERLEPGWQRQRMFQFTEYIWAGGKVDPVQDGWTKTYRRLNTPMMQGESIDSPAAEKVDLEIMESVRARIDEIVQDPAAAEALKPYYRFNCKRPGWHDEYLATFNRPNVHLVDTHGRGIDRFVPEGVVVDDQVIELDCIVFATGFEVGSGWAKAHPFHLEGRDHQQLGAKWSNGMNSFHGMHVHGFPNLFVLGVTQTGVSTNFAHSLVEQADHAAYVIKEAEARGVVVEASEAAEAEWVETIYGGITEAQKRFQASCTPGYFNNDGKPEDRNKFLGGRYPYGPIAFFKLLADWREEGGLQGLELTPRQS